MTIPRLLLTLWHRLIRSEPEPPLRLNPMPPIDLWAESGHYFRFNYSSETADQLDRHLSNIVADPCIPFSRADAAAVRSMIYAQEMASLAQFQLENSERL